MKRKVGYIFVFFIGFFCAYIVQETFKENSWFSEIKYFIYGQTTQENLNMAKKYYKGEGVSQNYRKAAEYLIKADKQNNNVEAEMMLGLMYQIGQGVPQSYQKSAEYAEKAANQNNKAAQEILGFMYRDGQGVPRNEQKAKSLFKQSCENGQQSSCDAYTRLNQKHTNLSP